MMKISSNNTWFLLHTDHVKRILRAKNAPVLPASHHDATEAFCPRMLIRIGPRKNLFMICQSPHDPPKRPLVAFHSRSKTTLCIRLLSDTPSDVWSCSLNLMFFLPTAMYPSSFNRVASEMKCVPYVVSYAPLTTLPALYSAVVPMLCCSDGLGGTSRMSRRRPEALNSHQSAIA